MVSPSLAASHDVVVGQDQAVRRQDDAGALFGRPPHVGLELDDAGHHLGGHLLDGSGGQACGGHAGRGGDLCSSAAVIVGLAPSGRRRRRRLRTPPRSSAHRRSVHRHARASAAAPAVAGAAGVPAARRGLLIGAGAAAGARRGRGRRPAGRPAAAESHTASRKAAADSRYARADRDTPPCGHRRAGGHGVPAAAAVNTSGGSSCRYGLFLRVPAGSPTLLQRRTASPRCPDGLRIHLEIVRRIPILPADRFDLSPIRPR